MCGQKIKFWESLAYKLLCFPVNRHRFIMSQFACTFVIWLCSPSIKEWNLFSHLLFVHRFCDLLWPTDCGRRDNMTSEVKSIRVFELSLSFSWNTALKLPCKEAHLTCGTIPGNKEENQGTPAEHPRTNCQTYIQGNHGPFSLLSSWTQLHEWAKCHQENNHPVNPQNHER